MLASYCYLMQKPCRYWGPAADRKELGKPLAPLSSFPRARALAFTERGDHDPVGVSKPEESGADDVASELQSSRDRLASVLETVADAIVTIDRSGIIDSFNPAAERMFGYSADEALGQNVSMLMPEPFRSEHDGYIERYLATGEARVSRVGREVTGQRKDGSTFPAEIAVSEIDHQQRFTGILRDISERKRTEEALERSREELRRLSARLLAAEDSERRRISRELHDDVNQRLAMLSIDIETLVADDTVSPDTLTTLESLRAQVAELSVDIHRMAYRLHPSILDDLGVAAAIRSFSDQFAKRHGIEVTVRERSVPVTIPTTVASCLYRVTQESLSNVAKHSKTSRVSIRLVGRSDGVRLSIRDFGVGFDVRAARNHRQSLGILSMEERVRLIGGDLVIRSFPRRGTSIRITVNWKAAPESRFER